MLLGNWLLQRVYYLFPVVTAAELIHVYAEELRYLQHLKI